MKNSIWDKGIGGIITMRILKLNLTMIRLLIIITLSILSSITANALQ